MSKVKDHYLYFPQKYDKIRDQQREALDFIIDNIEDKRFFILQAPTGIGKSAIALTLSKWIQDHMPAENQKGAYLVTTQKILQNQYIDDFPEIANIWSKSNYQCIHRNKMSCLEGQLLSKIFTNSKESQNCTNQCIYTRAMREFFKNPIGVTNMAYMLNQIEYNYHSENASMPQRQLLVIDECHNLEQSITDFVVARVTKRHCEEDIGIAFPEITDNLSKVKLWIEDHYLPGIEKKMGEMEDRISQIKSKSAEARAIAKQLSSFTRRKSHMERSMQRLDSSNWVLTYTNEVFEIKPIYASNFSERQLFCIGQKVVLMSATILDKETFCRNVGISEKESCFLSLSSPFPVENRQVIILPSGSMSYKNINKTLPEMHKMVQFLLEKHKGDKGIIHTNNYRIAKELVQKDKTKRLLLHDSKNREQIYDLHIHSSKDSVLISPSFTEGIDLYNDQSRFQIVCKIPFPYLADNYVKVKMRKCKKWYEWQTAKTIIQSLGRSIRSEKDHAESYILDSDWEFFYNRNRNMFPEWFKEALVFIS